jgi:RCC1 and BTB domain-containing protein
VECWHDIACGDYHTVGVTPTGDLYTWGRGAQGRLGHGNDDYLDKPKLVECLIGKKVVLVACGDEHTAVVTTEGEAYTWYVYEASH